MVVPTRVDQAQPVVVSEKWTRQAKRRGWDTKTQEMKKKKVYGPSTVDVCVHVYVQLLGEKRYISRSNNDRADQNKKKQCNERGKPDDG